MGKIVDIRDISEIVRDIKSRGMRIVFTNGCFDILHGGHVRYLKEARKYGDVVIVGLNSDRSVRNIKKGRPVMPESERAEVLAALNMIDYVVIFNDDTPLHLIKLIVPDVLVKGGDWKKEDIVGCEIVGEVHSLPYHKGLSTTEIIERIRSLDDDNV